MALTMMFECVCGRKYCVYVPKALLVKEAGCPISLKEAEEIDKEEEKNGEISLAMSTSKLGDLLFVDTRKTDVLQCSCGTVHDFIKFLRFLKLKSQQMKDKEDKEVKKLE